MNMGRCKLGCSQKKRVLWKQTAHTLSDVNHGVHVPQIDLTPTDSPTSPRLKLASCSSWFLNDSKIDRHNDAAIQQHTFLVMHLYTDVIPKKFFILIHRMYTSSKAQTILAIRSSHQKKSPMVPQYIVFILLNSSRLLLQQELNYTSDATKNLKHS